MEPEKKSNGALIGLVVIIIILVIGGIYVWMSNKNSNENSVNDPNIQTESLPTTTDSTELNTLEQEIDAADTDIDASAIDSVQ